MARDNESQYEHQMNTERSPMRQGTHDFSPMVHMLAGTLVPVVSTTHLVVWQLIGVSKPIPTLGCHKNLPTNEGNSMT